jgi:hypothetical protein
VYRICTYLDKDNIPESNNFLNKANSAKSNFNESLTTFGRNKISTALKKVKNQLRKAERQENKEEFIEIMHQDIREIIKSTKKGRKRKSISGSSKKKTTKKKLKPSPKIQLHPKQEIPSKQINKKKKLPVSKTDSSTPPSSSQKKKQASVPVYKNLFTKNTQTKKKTINRKPVNQKSITHTPSRSFAKMTPKQYLITNSKPQSVITPTPYIKTPYSKPPPTTINLNPTFSCSQNVLPSKVLAQCSPTNIIQINVNKSSTNNNNNNDNNNNNLNSLKTPIISKAKQSQQNLSSPVISNSSDISKRNSLFNGSKLYSQLKVQPHDETKTSSFSTLYTQIETYFPEINDKLPTNKTLNPTISKNKSNFPFKTPIENHKLNSKMPLNKTESSLNLKSIFEKSVTKSIPLNEKQKSSTFSQPEIHQASNWLHDMQKSHKILSLMQSMKKIIENDKKTIQKYEKKISQLSNKIKKLETVSIKKVKLTTSRACKAIELVIEDGTINSTSKAAVQRLFVTITKSELFKLKTLNYIETDGRLLSVGARGGSKLWLEITNRNQKNIVNNNCSDETSRKLENEIFKIIQYLGLNEKNLINILDKKFDTRVNGPVKFPSHKLFKCWAILPIASKNLFRRLINLIKKEEPQINLGSINCLAKFEKELSLESAVSEEMNFLIKIPTKKNKDKIKSKNVILTNVYEDRAYYHCNGIDCVTSMLNLGRKYHQIIHHKMLPPNQITFMLKSDKFGGGTETIINCINKIKPNSAQTSVILEYIKAPDRIYNMEISLKKNNKENIKNLTYHTTILTLLVPTENDPLKISVLLINDDKDTKNLELKEWVFKSMLFFDNKNADDEFPNGFFTTYLFM